MKTDSQPVAPQSREAGLVIEKLADETLIYDLDTHKAHCLNQTAYLVWTYCDGKRAVSDIADALARELNAPVNDETVWLALAQLSKENLLREKLSPPSPSLMNVARVSRRKMMRRMGMAAAIALPLVTSLVAPQAAEAGSPRGSGGACRSNSDCRSQTCVGGTCL